MVDIVWDIQAQKSFRKHINHIKKDSVQSAEKVKREIFRLIDDLISDPEKYPPDKFKLRNDGHYRAFEKHNLRIAYSFSETQIRILRVRHVHQEPKPF